jgi:TetR/AcrR family transcriptional regulator, transcriptional repressor for nem operon
MAEQGTVDPGPSAKTTTKATLIDVGTRLILEQGYHQTGIQDVLQAAGVPKGSFYYYFPSKEAFGQAVIAQFAAAYLARLEQHLGDTTARPLTRLRRHDEELLARFERRGCRGGCLIGNLSQELADQHPRLRAQLDAVLTSWRARYAQLFREAQAVGDLRTDLDPEALADFYLDSFEGALLRAKVSKSPAPLRVFLTCMFDGVLQGRPAGA